MFHDTIMSLVVVRVIVGLAVIWKWSAYGPHHDPHAQGNPRAGCMDPPADPGTTSFVPRPDWYFYFLFYLLRIFKWPESVFLGTVGVPTIALILLIGAAVPRPAADAEDLARGRSRWSPPCSSILSMGVLTWKGATAKEALASEIIADVPRWVQEEHLPANAHAGREALRGRRLHACHTYDGTAARTSARRT